MISEPLLKVDEFWAGYFGCSMGSLDERRTFVVPHAALRGYDDVLAFRHGTACIVSVPDTVPEAGREKLRQVPPDRAFDPEVLAKSFVVWRDQVLPPAWVGMCVPADFRPVSSAARLLTVDDSDAIRGLAEGCGEVAWNASEFYRRDPTFGVFAGKDLVAASGYVNMGGVLAYIGVVTHPQHRGKGYAKAAAGTVMEYAFNQDLVPMWRTVASNKAAVAVARSLGFRHYAFTIDVRLSPDYF